MRRSLFKDDLEVPYTHRDSIYNNILKKYINLDEPITAFVGYPVYKGSTVLNFIFNDTLVFQGFSRGRSSVKAEFIGTNTTNKYEMFLSDFEECFSNELFNGYSIKGDFCFRKAGANYGVVRLDD